MKINNEPKLDFDDVLLVPQRSRTASRSLVKLSKTYNFYHSTRTWNGIPIMIANMSTTGTFAMSKSLSKYQVITCLHKHYSKEEYINMSNIDYTWYSMGIKKDDLDKLSYTCDMLKTIPNICIDVANGYTDDFVNFCKNIRQKFGNEPIIMAGNVCTPEMVQELILHGGVDIVKVGIGPGSACTTRLKTGCGYPQLSAISECSHAAHGLKSKDKHLGLICADGGCKIPADVAKAFAANSDFAMLGGMFSATEECEGDWKYEYKCSLPRPQDVDSYKDTLDWWQSIKPDDFAEKRKVSLTFYGMSSHLAQEKFGGVKNYRSSEGRVLEVKYKGYAEDVLFDILGGLRSCCAYVGADSLKDLPKCAEFILVNRTHFNQSV